MTLQEGKHTASSFSSVLIACSFSCQSHLTWFCTLWLVWFLNFILPSVQDRVLFKCAKLILPYPELLALSFW